MTQSENETKEDFCGLCISVPLAFAGVGAGAYGTSKGSHKKYKKISLWIGIISIIISLLIAGYYIFYRKDCKSCQFSKN